MRYPPIEDHGLIGDMRTAALVGIDGAVDFFCFPEFDSPTVFASLLDPEKGGSFRIAPAEERPRGKQLYLPDTNVLLTRFLCDRGVAEITDFMPVGHDEPRMLVRRVRVVRGQVRLEVACRPRFDYGRTTHRTHAVDDGVEFTPANGGRGLRLASPVSLRVDEDGASATFELREGREAAFVLEEATGRPAPKRQRDVTASLARTIDHWRGWVRDSSYRGRWRSEVHRSALALKLLTYAPHGSIVAAPTFGLPEAVGRERNWDYRYTWIRDAAFTLYALTRLGYTAEAGAFARFVMARCDGVSASDSPLQIMYGIRGETDLRETPLAHLAGYRHSQPVRVGNAAHGQLQLDIYGALLDAVYLYDKYGERVGHAMWSDSLVPLIDWVCHNWRQRDHGIWEIRGETREYLSSRLLSWVAVDRGYRLALKRSLPGPLEHWRATRDEIHHHIHERFFDPNERAFVQSRGSSRLDASCLLMPLLKFIGPTDPRWLDTLAAVERELVEDAFVHRYRTGPGSPDPFDGPEGSFNVCSFWYVECLSRAGRLAEARHLFEKILSHANHVGLFSEELGPRGEHLGNFPQAFTHLGLISAAYDIDRRLSDGSAP